MPSGVQNLPDAKSIRECLCASRGEFQNANSRSSTPLFAGTTKGQVVADSLDGASIDWPLADSPVSLDIGRLETPDVRFAIFQSISGTLWIDDLRFETKRPLRRIRVLDRELCERLRLRAHGR